LVACAFCGTAVGGAAVGSLPQADTNRAAMAATTANKNVFRFIETPFG